MILGLILIVGLGLMTDSAYGAWWQFWKKEAKAVAQPEAKENSEVAGTESEPAKAIEEKGTQAVAEMQPQNQEKYVRKELVAFSWGKGEYQLGVYVNTEDDPGCAVPGPLKVNNKGEVFICDSINKRIVKYSSKGNFLTQITSKNIDGMWSEVSSITFDKNDNLYLNLWLGDKPGIAILSSDLVLSKLIKYEPFYGFFRQITLRDKDIYLLKSLEDQYSIYKVDISTELLEKKDKEGKLQKQHTELFSMGTFSISASKQKKVDKISMVSFKTMEERKILLTSSKKPIKTQWIGEDEEENCFFHLSTLGKDLIDEIRLLQKYSKKGGLLTEIILDKHDHPFSIWVEPYHLLDIDNYGNIYQLWLGKKEAKLIKWEKEMK